MTAQLRENIGPMQGNMVGRRLWIVGSGPTVDDVDVRRLGKNYIVALNWAIMLFAGKPHPNAWWMWWDQRTRREVWPQLAPVWGKPKIIIHKKGMEEMRSHKGAGRYVCYGSVPAFRPKRSVVETALITSDFLGFSETVLVGVDGFATRDDNRPYCRQLNDKDCHFMNRNKPGSWKNSSQQFVDAINQMPKLGTRIIQTSDLCPDVERFERESFDSVLGRVPVGDEKKIDIRARESI